ncbi:hypothetical protein [Paenibacillus sp. An7]|uniref:hypothetical protein n=1 Tax=Paenibacillus sp. An7 TaxID=2689577 RepID=UPI00135C61CF|nr:hypothetical protein [Paenibacillus sp. An7]
MIGHYASLLSNHELLQRQTYHDLDATLRFSPIMNFFKDNTQHDWTLHFASLQS